MRWVSMLLGLTITGGIGVALALSYQPNQTSTAQPTPTPNQKTETSESWFYFSVSELKLLSDPDIDPSLPEGVKEAHKSTGMISLSGSLGSTSYLGRGVWITNRHVTSMGRGNPVIRMTDGTEIPGEVVCEEPSGEDTRDIALVLTDDPGIPPIKIAKQMPAVGDLIIANGSPFGRPEVITKGTIVELRPGGVSNSDMLFGEVEVNPGNSGGPALNEKGELIGMVTFKNGSIGIAIGIPLILDTLKQVADGQICTGETPARPKAGNRMGPGGGQQPRQMPPRGPGMRGGPRQGGPGF